MKTLIEEKFEKDWILVDRDTDVFLVSRKSAPMRRVISFVDNEEGSVIVEGYDVKGLLYQEDSVINFMLGYFVPEEEIEDKKKELKEDVITNSDNDIMMFCDLQSHNYGSLIDSEIISFDDDDTEKWLNSERILEVLSNIMTA